MHKYFPRQYILYLVLSYSNTLYRDILFSIVYLGKNANVYILHYK